MKMNNYYNIDTSAHYFVPMRPLQRVLGFFSFTSSSDPEHFIECEVQPYDIEGINYKCYLVPVTEEYKYNFGRERSSIVAILRAFLRRVVSSKKNMKATM